MGATATECAVAVHTVCIYNIDIHACDYMNGRVLKLRNGQVSKTCEEGASRMSPNIRVQNRTTYNTGIATPRETDVSRKDGIMLKKT